MAVTAAALTWMTYDICLTLKDEVSACVDLLDLVHDPMDVQIRLIWKSKFILLKCLYLAVRYYTLISLM
jgi:hypothetical protein